MNDAEFRRRAHVILDANNRCWTMRTEEYRKMMAERDELVAAGPEAPPPPDGQPSARCRRGAELFETLRLHTKSCPSCLSPKLLEPPPAEATS